jgi:GNAT superfamily N-acetyltransferase
MASLTPRIASEPDVPSLLGMMDPFNLGERLPWDAASKEPALRRLLADTNLGLVVLLELEARPVGYFVLTWGYDLEWDGRDAFMTELFLIPDVRGRGLGGVALTLTETFAREYGARALHLMVLPENAAALRLYSTHGYESPPRTFLSKPLAG